MNWLSSIELSNTTLLVTFILPFGYFIYHTKYWYRLDALKKFDLFLSSVAVIAAIMVALRLFQIMQSRRSGDMSLGLIHIALLVLTLLIVSQGRSFRKFAVNASSGEPARAPGESGKDQYAPVPLNADIEKLNWDNLIIDDSLKHELISVCDLLRDPKTTRKYGIEVPKGILLNGPPGTGKTTIAKVIANTANLSFFAIKSDEVVSKWVGESEKNLTKLFQAALKAAPSVIFIDEVDSIGKTRSGSQVWADNLLNHLLQLIDGIVKQEGLYVIAATNRADLVDSALKRSGRLNRVIEVPLPNFEARAQLFALYLSRLALEEHVDIHLLAEFTEGKSGADIKEICNQAGLYAFKRESASGKKREYLVTTMDLEQALNDFVQPA